MKLKIFKDAEIYLILQKNNMLILINVFTYPI